MSCTRDRPNLCPGIGVRLKFSGGKKFLSFLNTLFKQTFNNRFFKN